VSGDYREQGEGYDNQATRGMGKRTNGRAKLLWEPNEALSLLVGFAYEKRDAFTGGSETNARPPTLALTTTSAPIFPGHKVQRQYWAEAGWDVGPVTVTYLPSFRSWEQDDLIFGTSNFRSSGVPRWNRVQTPKDNFLTHELRIASRDDAAVQWQAGAFYYRNLLNNASFNYLVNSSGGVLAFLSDTRDQKDTMNLGYFAETTISLTDSLRTTLGARYDDTEVVVSEYIANNPYGACGTVAQAGVVLPAGATCIGPGQASVPVPPGTFIPDIGVNFHNFNYKARLEYDLTPKHMLYGVISTGFRPGDAGINGNTRLVNILNAEKLTSIEIGSKNRFLDDSLQLNVGVYHYLYHGFQTTYRPDTAAFDPGLTANPIAITVPAENLGGEVELLYRLTAQDRIGLNGNYVESRWFDKPAAFAAAQPEEERAMTPYTLTANYAHEFHLPGGSTFSARIDGRYEAARLGSNLHVDWLRLGYGQYVELSSRTIGNLSAGWTSVGGRYSINAYVRNFTDKQYIAYTVGGDQTSLGVSWTDPRTYGAQISARF
jgi:iron complex outermembrane receptor protein